MSIDSGPNAVSAPTTPRTTPFDRLAPSAIVDVAANGGTILLVRMLLLAAALLSACIDPSDDPCGEQSPCPKYGMFTDDAGAPIAPGESRHVALPLPASTELTISLGSTRNAVSSAVLVRVSIEGSALTPSNRTVSAYSIVLTYPIAKQLPAGSVIAIDVLNTPDADATERYRVSARTFLVHERCTVCAL